MSFGTRSHRNARRGFALPVVMMMVFLLMGALAAGFSLSRSERAIDDAGRSDIYAQSNAESALERALTDRASLGLAAGTPPATDSVRVTLSQGYADVIVTRVRPVVGSEPADYLVRAHGFSTASRVAGTPSAQYTQTQLAVWQTGTFSAKAAFTSITGFSKNGAASAISGADGCGAKATLAGVEVPRGGYSGSGAGIAGNPAVDSSLGANSAALAAATPIDWVSIRGGSITPDFTSTWSGSGFPTSTWFTTNTTTFPTIVVNNDSTNAQSFTLPTSGHGLLIVYGNIIISGSIQWDGVIFVGGTLTSNGNNTVNGAVVTGLNVKLGWTVASTSVGNGTKNYNFNSCQITSALSSFSTMRPYKNTWSNTYAVY